MAPPAILGADPDDLRRLARSFERAAEQVRGVRVLVARSTHAPPGVRHQLDLADAGLRVAAGRCAAAAAHLRRQAAEQDRAAAAASGTGRSGGHGGHGGRAPDGTGRGRTRPLPQPLPVSESVLLLDGQLVVAGVEGRAGLTARVEELVGRRSRVTVADTLGAGLSLAAGTAAEAGCGTGTVAPRRSRSPFAEAGLGVGLERRTVWEVPDDDVHRLLAAEAGVRAAQLVGLGPIARTVARRLGPEPAGHEILARATVAASAGTPPLGRVGPSVAGRSSSAVAVGVAVDRTGQRRLLLETAGEHGGVLRAGLLERLGVPAGERSGSATVRVEIGRTVAREVGGRARGNGGGRPVRVEARSSTRPGTYERVVVHGTLSPDAAAVRALEAAVRRVAAGGAPSAGAAGTALEGLAAGLRGATVQVDRLEAASVGCTARAGAGPAASGGAGAVVVNLRRG